MAFSQTFTCDRCNHQQDSDDQMWSVAIAYKHGYAAESHLRYANNMYFQHGKLWCRKCMEELQLLGGMLAIPELGEAEKVKPAPTLEDIIREIVREEIGE